MTVPIGVIVYLDGAPDDRLERLAPQFLPVQQGGSPGGDWREFWEKMHGNDLSDAAALLQGMLTAGSDAREVDREAVRGVCVRNGGVAYTFFNAPAGDGRCGLGIEFGGLGELADILPAALAFTQAAQAVVPNSVAEYLVGTRTRQNDWEGESVIQALQRLQSLA